MTILEPERQGLHEPTDDRRGGAVPAVRITEVSKRFGFGSSAVIALDLQFAREFSDTEALIAAMIVVLLVGILVDSLVFGQIERRVLVRRGLHMGRTPERAVVSRRKPTDAAFAR